MSPHYIAIILNVIALAFVIAVGVIVKKSFDQLKDKFDILNDYMKTVITQYAENVSYSQGVLLLNIFSRAAKYKIYSMIVDELDIADSRSIKSGDLLMKITIFIESTVRDMRVNLGAFKYGGRHLSASFIKSSDVDAMTKKIVDYLSGKNIPVKGADRRAERLVVKEILSEYFDSISLS